MVCTVKAMVFPIIMCRCESWTIKKAECQRTDAFELWWGRRLLTVPWTARRSNQWVLKEIKPVNPKGNQPWIFIRRTDAEALILWPPDGKSLLLGKDPDAGKDWGHEEKGQQRIRWMDGIINSMTMSLRKLRRQWMTGKPGLLQSMGLQRVKHNWVTEKQWI